MESAPVPRGHGPVAPPHPNLPASEMRRELAAFSGLQIRFRPHSPRRLPVRFGRVPRALNRCQSGPRCTRVFPMRNPLPTVVLAALGLLSAGGPVRAQQPVVVPTETVCGPLGSSYMRTTLYFGLNRKAGNISESQWKSFLRQEVTPRFPQGLTVWQAGGQWRRSDGAIVRERSKVLLLVHDEKAEVRSSVTAIIERYKQLFEQESVLWETARVCAAF